MDDIQRLGLGFLMEQLVTFIGQSLARENQTASEIATLKAEVEALTKRLNKREKKES